MYSLKDSRGGGGRSNLLDCSGGFVTKTYIFWGDVLKLVSHRELGVAQLPPFQRRLCLPFLSLCLFLCPSVIRACPPASRTPQQPLSDHLAGTQLRNCASRQMPCRTVEGWWRWGNAISLCPSCSFSPLPLPSLPSPGLPTVLTLNTPPSTPSPPALSSQACPSRPREQWGELCVSALPNNYLQLRLTAVWPSERLSH